MLYAHQSTLPCHTRQAETPLPLAWRQHRSQPCRSPRQQFSPLYFPSQLNCNGFRRDRRCMRFVNQASEHPQFDVSSDHYGETNSRSLSAFAVSGQRRACSSQSSSTNLLGGILTSPKRMTSSLKTSLSKTQSSDSAIGNAPTVRAVAWFSISPYAQNPPTPSSRSPAFKSRLATATTSHDGPAIGATVGSRCRMARAIVNGS